MPRTNWGDLARYPVVLPPTFIAMEFTELTRKAVSRIVASTHENRTSAALRDSLLPQLISGEIRLGQKEERA
jgi:type I restriction enzyme S subunit